ncbi:MAG: DUF1587 domain-containing protein [Candidatus Synoicihabitans palmerolidicus]|nr:DUF1587 domain-containing protein [Candidatus Synoicihabitans palmerolidicus]
MIAGIGLAAPGHEQVAYYEVITSFRDQIEIVMDEFCYDCHGYGGDKGGVILDGWEGDDDLLDHSLWVRVLRNVRAGIMPPAGEYQPSAEQKEAIVQWIKEKAFQLDAEHPDPGRVTVRRLHRVEYRNTVKDLMGVDFDTAVEFPVDDTGHGFDNIADVLTISPMLLEKYLDAAQKIVDEAVPKSALVVASRWVPGKAFKSKVAVEETTDDSDEAGQERPASEVWQAGEVTNKSLDLVYYSPAAVATTHVAEHAGRYEVVVNMQALERYVDDEFDLNKCTLVVQIDGETLLEREMVRESYGRRFGFSFEREWTAGEHEIGGEMTPVLPAREQIRSLRLRLNDVVVRGPFDPDHHVAPWNYTDYFPRPVPADEAEQRNYAEELLSTLPCGRSAARPRRRR